MKCANVDYFSCVTGFLQVPFNAILFNFLTNDFLRLLTKISAFDNKSGAKIKTLFT